MLFFSSSCVLDEAWLIKPGLPVRCVSLQAFVKRPSPFKLKRKFATPVSNILNIFKCGEVKKGGGEKAHWFCAQRYVHRGMSHDKTLLVASQ